MEQQVRVSWPTRSPVTVTLVSHSGSSGRWSSSSLRWACGLRPSIVSTNRNSDPAAHACGEQATGYGTGTVVDSRSKPQNSSGRRKSAKCWLAWKIRPTSRFVSSWKP